MMYKATISSQTGEKYRVMLQDGRVSGLLAWLEVLSGEAQHPSLAPGDQVVVVFFGSVLADGAILGKVVE